ncbi:MAG TPA: FAD-binding oxidoreductase [Dehalococcoidia bacterium]|nr:FAD-binding oxidoreductase [Dehalococcoidia bacterium]
MEKTITKQLSEIVGEQDISTSPLERRLNSHDAAPVPGLLTLFFKTMPEAVVRPESADEVARILRLASDCRVPVIPRAAGSWSLGGVTPVKGGIVLDLVKLNKITKLSTDGLWVEVEAGIVWQDLIDQLLEKGMTVLSVPTSAPSSTVGGWVSTGGYGIGSLKYGRIGEQIQAIEVVTPKGDIVQVAKDSADPKMEWFIGTEGQLGVITKVKLKIRRKPKKSSVHGVWVAGDKELAEFASEVAKLKEIPYSLKILDAGLMSLNSALHNGGTEDRNLVLVEFEGSAEEVSYATTTFNQIVKQRGLQPSDENLAQAEWQERYYPMRIGRLGPTLLGGETIVPIEQLEPVLKEIKHLQKKYHTQFGIEAQVISKGWVMILALYLADERKAIRFIPQLAIIRDIVHIGLSHGGKPYGIGLWNSVYVKQQFGKEYLKELKGAKKRLDLEGIMNPGKFFRTETRFGIPLHPILYNMVMNILSIARRFQ